MAGEELAWRNWDSEGWTTAPGWAGP